MCEDDWVRVAMDDDKLVVDLLLKLNQPVVVLGPPPAQPRGKLAPIRLDWSVRQRRSSSSKKQQQQQPSGSKRTAAKKETSPTTPLSWSGGGGATSSAADGFEESSSRPHISRSKVAIASGTQSTKRSRKKKTLAELREEESSLLTERRNLNNRLAALRIALEKERAKNESFKRIKLDLLSRQTSAVTVASKSVAVICDQPHKMQAERDPACSIAPTSAACSKLEQSLPDTPSDSEDLGGGHSSVFLPDLNLPVDEDSGSDVLYGTS